MCHQMLISHRDTVLMVLNILSIYLNVLWIGGMLLIVKLDLGACPQIIIENNTEIHCYNLKQWLWQGTGVDFCALLGCCHCDIT